MAVDFAENTPSRIRVSVYPRTQLAVPARARRQQTRNMPSAVVKAANGGAVNNTSPSSQENTSEPNKKQTPNIQTSLTRSKRSDRASPCLEGLGHGELADSEDHAKRDQSIRRPPPSASRGKTTVVPQHVDYDHVKRKARAGRGGKGEWVS
ncbi:hypothetical protein PLEOSDRAFT_1089980 [Pleurotus ostreatus PC15]|uniref:Uncharacterized protein n=1 Tax=Pleurotus ostreatus (strain PC15) TaxID=1137138 RepID=A0A067NH11_PLEO1|nr:hypothetical protein PLEOSDRAFT_1089980 [Pleurotus ostreatus PC15]